MSILEALPKEEVIKAVERRNPIRVPVSMARWWGEGLHEQYGDRLSAFDKYPDDCCRIWFPQPGTTPRGDGYYWRLDEEHLRKSRMGHDAGAVTGWEWLDAYESEIPNFEAPGLFDPFMPIVEEARKRNQYLILCWWGLFYEPIWGLRGMENLLMDYYLHPEEIHRLHKARLAFYEGLIRRAAEEIAPDAFQSSDDLGHQTQLMMNPTQFREFIKPYYTSLYRLSHKLGMHTWLHTCGNVTDIMCDLIESGLDVVHPIQKGAMDGEQIAKDWGDKISFWAGMDVQHALQEETPEGVRREVRWMIDTYDGHKGGLIIAAGNGIVAGTPFDNIEAFLDESYRYGTEHRR
ncbi:MAG TPA: uroporphyrinogen decarboxylase family protein [bacterium]|nr:uroporphyrinogen decarboxylase family protein [bacterium]